MGWMIRDHGMNETRSWDDDTGSWDDDTRSWDDDMRLWDDDTRSWDDDYLCADSRAVVIAPLIIDFKTDCVIVMLPSG